MSRMWLVKTTIDWLKAIEARRLRPHLPTTHMAPVHWQDLDTLEPRVMLSGSIYQDPYLPASVVISTAAPRLAESPMVSLAKALTDVGATFFGAHWCPSCNQQKAIFEEGVDFLPYVEVGGAQLGIFNQTFYDENLTAVPTWQFADGTRLAGMQSLETLAMTASVDSAPFFAAIDDQSVLDNAPQLIEIDGFNPGGGVLTYTATSSNPNIKPTVLRGNRSVRIVVQNFGEMVFELFENLVPRVTNHFIDLASSGFFNGIGFHRIIDGFVIQAGDPTGTGGGGSSLGSFTDQFSTLLQHVRTGLLSMAKSSDDTNDSQFFITEGMSRHLDFNHSIYGLLVEGEQVREIISNVPLADNGSGQPENPVIMELVEVFTDDENAVILIDATIAAAGEQADVTVTMTDEDGDRFERTFQATVEADPSNGGPFLEDIPQIRMLVNTPVSFQLSSIDVEGDNVSYDAMVFGNPRFDFTIDNVTGEFTVTPPEGDVGTLGLLVGVRPETRSNTTDTFDTQLLEIQIDEQPFIDLVVQMNRPNLPATAMAGMGVSIPLPVTVANEGNVAVPDGTAVNIQIFARPLGTNGSADTLLATYVPTELNGLANSAAVHSNLSIPLLQDLDPNDYVFLVQVDGANLVSESDETNNTAVTRDAIATTIEAPIVDLAVAFGTITAPPIVNFGVEELVTVDLIVTNHSNSPLPAAQEISVRIQLANDLASETLTEPSDVQIGGLQPGTSQTITFHDLHIPGNLSAGTYHFEATLDTTNTVLESDESNNNAASTQIVVVADSPYDLVAALDKMTVPPTVVAGIGAKVKVPVIVRNRGDQTLPKGQKIDVRIVARPVGADDDSGDTTLLTLTGQSVSNLKPGASKKINANITIPGNLDEGDYNLVAQLDLADIVNESNESNNEAVSDDATSVAAAFVDLVTRIGDMKLPTHMVSGDGTKIKIPATVTNEGNVVMAAGQKIDVQVFAKLTAETHDTSGVLVATVKGQLVGALKPGKAKKMNMTVILPDSLPTGDYILVVKADSAGQIPELNEDNNTASSPMTQVIRVEPGVIDLTGTFNKIRMPASVIAGARSKGKLPIVITNDGNVAVANGMKIDVHLVARPITGGADQEITKISGVSISNLKPGKSKKVNANVMIPANLAEGNYRFVAMIDGANDIDESHETNNEAVTATVTFVAAPFADLSGTIDRLSGPDPLGAGDKRKAKIRVINHGNVPVVSGQTIDVRFVARPVDTLDASTDIELGTLANASIGGLKPGKSKNLNGTAMISGGIVPGNYNFLAFIDSSNEVFESDETNNTAIFNLGIVTIV